MTMLHLAALLALVSVPFHAQAGANRTNVVREVLSGPWGRVRYTPLQVMPSTAAVQDFVNEPQQIRWFVMIKEQRDVEAFMLGHGFQPSVVSGLMSRGQATLDRRGWILFPEPETVLALTREARVRFYTALGVWIENPRHRSPFRLSDHAIEDWRTMAQLPKEALARFDELTYPRGTLTVFTDLPLMLNTMAGNPSAQSQFLRSICSESTYLATLRVLPGDSVDDLLTYWGAGGREEEVRPLIEAAARAGGEIGVPLPLLLPGFPRRVLYTYPEPQEMRFLDCHFSSINFFSREPDLRMLQGMYRDTFFNAFYEEVPAADRLGDVIILISPTGEVVHSCVRIAGELVFTKNGGQRTLPWMLMTLDDTLEYFSTEGQLTMKYYRRKVIDNE